MSQNTASASHSNSITILRLPKVKERTGLGRATIYSKVSKKEFPSPILLGGSGSRSVGWIEEEITQWIEQRKKESRGQK